ncbi:hypothetical protein [Mesorhizobium sp. J8]|uniref:hypothetical protein n=1 Tax=Mesorhizobium sp. J8 TaxID=2777475 RepID=UPI001915E9B2|nr:hypothetical protein [Mesorhizobium sp. J8]BCM18882.1 hypothetical protein MJ8_26540 [Mesorhizobium sp. J8]
MSSTLSSTALVISQQHRLPSIARPVASARVNSSPTASPPMQAEPAVSASMFSVDSLNITAIKVRLMERAGKEFAVDQTGYESVSSYGLAIKNAVEALKRQSPSAIAGIEKQLGLDQLGVSLDTLVEATVDPRSGNGERLDAALRQHAGGPDEGDAASTQLGELGFYGR